MNNAEFDTPKRLHPWYNRSVKICSKCGEEKEFSDFYPDPRYRGGYMHQCRLCKDKAHKAWCQANRPVRVLVGRSSRKPEDYEARLIWKREHRSEDVLRRRIRRFVYREERVKNKPVLTREEELAKLIKAQEKDDRTYLVKYGPSYFEQSVGDWEPHTVYNRSARIV